MMGYKLNVKQKLGNSQTKSSVTVVQIYMYKKRRCAQSQGVGLERHSQSKELILYFLIK